jgi:Holliday junction resolvase RusA-like endonuclease
MELHVRVHGRPAPEGSHEVGQHGHIMHSSNYLKAWRHAVDRDTRRAYLAAGLTGRDMPLIPNPRPVYLHRVEILVGPDQCRAAGTDEPTGTPDFDKLLRATVDGLAAARVFANDSQIVKAYDVGKSRSDSPGAEIIISDRPLLRPEGEITIMGSNFPPFRLTLERHIGEYEDGSPQYETVFMLVDRGEIVRSAGVATLGALLGDVTVSVTEPAPVDGPTTEAPKPAGRKPRKAAAAPAEQPAAAPAPAPAAPVPAEPAPAVQAPAPAVQATPVNPFAR